MMTLDQLEYGIVNYGTPLYVFDLDETKKAVSELRKKTDGIARICYAMKANPFLTRQMAELTDRIEVCSMGEYEICRELQIPADKLLISGVRKEKTDLERILEEHYDECLFSVESMNQFYYIAEWCQTYKTPVRVLLRLTSGNQFGMDEQTLKDLIAVRKTCPYVKIEGLHFFSGTQKKSSDVFRKELSRIDRLLHDIEEKHAFAMEELEYGPGIEIPYFIGQEDRREEDIDSLCQAVREMNWSGKVTLEMGRYLVGTAGYYLTGVRDMKINGQSNYCIVDGGIHQFHYDGQIRGMYHPYLWISPQRNTGAGREWTICGSLCTDNDVLISKIDLQELKCGDVLIFHRAGAYAMTEGMALFLSHSLPKVAVHSRKRGWKLIRAEQQTFMWNMEREIEDGDIDQYFNGYR